MYSMDQITKSSLGVCQKFELFRVAAEEVQRKGRESEIVAGNLKDDLEFSRKVEKTLRIQLSQAENRVIQLQKSHNEIKHLTEQNQKHGKVILDMDVKIENIQTLINEAKEKNKSLISSTSREIELLKVNDDLKEIIQKNSVDLDLMKIEIQTIKNEKNGITLQYEDKMVELNNELKEARAETGNIKMYSDQVLMSYKKQLADCETIIQQYERERHQLLGEFQPAVQTGKSILKKTEGEESENGNPKKKQKVTWGYNSVSSYSRESCQDEETPMDSAPSLAPGKDSQETSKSAFERDFTNERPLTTFVHKKKKFSRIGMKPKFPILNFKTNENEKNEAQSPTPQRHLLYSANENEYLY